MISQFLKKNIGAITATDLKIDNFTRFSKKVPIVSRDVKRTPATHQQFQKKYDDPSQRFTTSFDKRDERVGTEISEEYPEDFDEIESDPGLKGSISESIHNTKDFRSSHIRESIPEQSGKYFGSGSGGIKESIRESFDNSSPSKDRHNRSIDEEIMTESIIMSGSKSGINFKKSGAIEEDISGEYSNEQFDSINESIQESQALKDMKASSHYKKSGISPRQQHSARGIDRDSVSYSKFRDTTKHLSGDARHSFHESGGAH